MTELPTEDCEACQVGAPLLSEAELKALLPKIPAWQVVQLDGIEQLERVFVFADFVEAQAFTNKVGDLAEQAGHHPAILLEWGKVTVRWWTHKIHGIHRLDVTMAEKTDALVKI